ncbi:hypothetical protein, partial [Sphingosinicella sp.]|uniref:hypothetical protein n=1 Tax=Sphingosinicella sp. TaxID=1917971 RepID=UPI00261BB85F
DGAEPFNGHKHRALACLNGESARIENALRFRLQLFPDPSQPGSEGQVTERPHHIFDHDSFNP